MSRGLGKALENALSGNLPEESTAPVATPLLNAHRRRIFEYLCLRPFQTSGGVAGDLKYAPSSVSWHLRSLVASGYVACREDGMTYYPRDFVDPDDAKLFIASRGAKRRALLRLIISSPGISQIEAAKAVGMSRQTAGRTAASYAELGLIAIVHDGRFSRWYPTGRLKEKQEAQHMRSRAFTELFLRKLEKEGQNPEVLRRTTTELQVRIGKGKERGVLSLPIDPYGALAD